MSQSGYLFLGLTAIVAALSGVLAYAVLRIFAAARAATRDDKKTGSETAFMAAAMEDAVRKLRDGERAMKARAEASERLSSEIVASLTSGLLVVDRDGIVRTLNPAGQTMLRLAGNRWEGPYREVLKDAGLSGRRARRMPDDIEAGGASGCATHRRRRIAPGPHGLADSRGRRRGRARGDLPLHRSD